MIPLTSRISLEYTHLAIKRRGVGRHVLLGCFLVALALGLGMVSSAPWRYVDFLCAGVIAGNCLYTLAKWWAFTRAMRRLRTMGAVEV